MSGIDTSAEAVERLAASADHYKLPGAAAALRALLAERDRLRGALWKITARVDRLTGGLTYTEKATRDIARAALGEGTP